MAKAIQRRRGTSAEHSSFTGLAGELTIDTTNKRVVLHDGATAGGIPAAKLSEAIRAGYHLIGCWDARAVLRPTTSGADAIAQAESSTNKLNYEHIDFPNAATKYVEFSFRAPESLDESATFDCEIEWEEGPSATAHVCRWQAEMQAQGDGDTIDSAFGTAVAADDTGSAGTRRKIKLTGITPAGSWAAGDTIHVRVARLGGHANDTLDVGARLIRATLFATVNAGADA